MDSKLWVWNVFGGVGSIGNTLPNTYNILSFDWDFRSQDRKNEIKITYDISKLSKNDIINYYNQYPCNVACFSPPCENFSNIKNNGLHHRYLDKAYTTANATFFIIDILIELNPDLLYYVENPKSGKFIEYCNKKGLEFEVTSYCLWNEKKNINGVFLDTYPYRKNTIFVTNIPNLNFVECKNDCDICGLNGYHPCIVGGFDSRLKDDQYSHTDLTKLFKNYGYIPNEWTTTDVANRIPRLCLLHIFKCISGM